MLGQILVNVSDELSEKFTELVEKRQQSKAAVLRHFIEEYVKQEGEVTYK